MELKLNNIRSHATTVESAAKAVIGGLSFTQNASVNGVEIDMRRLRAAARPRVDDAIEAVAAAMAATDWYWQDGSAYCPACVECESPAIDATDPHVQRGGGASICACCGTDYRT